MAFKMNTYVRFRADFDRPKSIHEPSGEELADFLIEGLADHGIAAQRSDDADFQHYLECNCGDSQIKLAVGLDVFDDNGDDHWSIMLCCRPSKSFFRRKVPSSDTLPILHAISDTIGKTERIKDIRWYPLFDTPEALSLIPYSHGPDLSPNFYEQVHPLIRLEWSLIRIAFPAWCVFCLLTAILVPLGPQFGELGSRVLQFGFGITLVLFFATPIVLGRLIHRAGSRRLDNEDIKVQT
jgi:hypothetical protein